jgi:hypothetical protein
MPRRRKPREPGEWLVPPPQTDVDDRSSLLDVLDSVLNRGALLNGDVVLGVANVDLVYVKLSVLLAAFDKATRRKPVFTPVPDRPKKKRRR